MAERVFSIKDRKMRLDTPEDCNEVLGQLRASTAFERVEFNGNTVSSPAAKALAEAVATQTELKVHSSFCSPACALPPLTDYFFPVLLDHSLLLKTIFYFLWCISQDLRRVTVVDK